MFFSRFVANPSLGLASVSRCLPLSTLSSVSHTLQKVDRQNSLCKPEVSFKKSKHNAFTYFPEGRVRPSNRFNFRKSAKGGGVIFNPKIYVADFRNLLTDIN